MQKPLGKPVVPRVVAEEDLDRAFVHYLETAGPGVAADFLKDFQSAVVHISRFPSSGSPKYGDEPSLAGIRFWPLKTFPYLIFYLETDHHIDVWRVMHDRMDIPAGLQDPGANT